jgi:hypothetical protein
MPDRWLAKKLYPELPRDMRLRRTRHLLLWWALAVLAALIVGGGLVALNLSNRLGG